MKNWTTKIGDITALLQPCMRECLRMLNESPHQTVSVLLTDDTKMQSLNESYRQINRPTNVLSFVSYHADGAPVGDLAFGFETCVREAVQQEILLEQHLCHLFVHGLLHLYGYDHETKQQAGEMEKLESRILINTQHPDPWANEASQ